MLELQQVFHFCSLCSPFPFSHSNLNQIKSVSLHLQCCKVKFYSKQQLWLQQRLVLRLCPSEDTVVRLFFFFCIKAFASLSACVGKGLKMKTLGELGTPQSTKAMLGLSSHAAFQHRPRLITSLYKRLLQLFVVCLRAGEGVKIAELCVFVSYYPCEVHSIAFPQLFQR